MMDWLEHVLPNPWFPNLTTSVLVWLVPFGIASVYFIRLAWKAWKAYSYQVSILSYAERLFALGKLISYLDSMLIVTAGLVAGILAAAGPHTVVHFDPRAAGITLALLVIPIGKLFQGVLMQFIFNRAEEALRAESTKERVGNG